MSTDVTPLEDVILNVESKNHAQYFMKYCDDKGWLTRGLTDLALDKMLDLADEQESSNNSLSTVP